MDSKDTATVSYVAFESVLMRHERITRWLVAIIILLAASVGGVLQWKRRFLK